jgi:hypothetical protein
VPHHTEQAAWLVTEKNLYEVSAAQLILADEVEQERMADVGFSRASGVPHMLYGELACDGCRIQLVTNIPTQLYLVTMTVSYPDGKQAPLSRPRYVQGTGFEEPEVYIAHRNGDIVAAGTGSLTGNQSRLLDSANKKDVALGERLIHLVTYGRMSTAHNITSSNNRAS